MKRKTLRLLVIILTISTILNTACIQICAANFKREIVNNGVKLNAPLKLIDNTVFVPFRPLLEAFNWEVYWDSVNSQVVGCNNEDEIVLKIGECEVFVNEELIYFSKPPVNINGTVYVESRFIAQNFGKNIIWNKEDNLIVNNRELSDTEINGIGNIVIAGSNMIVNITEAYSANTINDMVREADEILERGIAASALLKYEGILRNISYRDKPDLYAHIMYNMGNAYLILANNKDLKRNLLQAISKYEEAVKYFDENKQSLKYHSVVKNLANAYGILGQATNDYELINRSIEKYNKIIEYFEYETDPINYATILFNLGRNYFIIGEMTRAEDSLVQAEKACNSVLNFIDDESSDLYAAVQFNLGNVYKLMSEIKRQKEFLEKSKVAYEEAMKIWTVEIEPAKYASTNKCIGDVYKLLISYEDEGLEEIFEKSLKMFEEALKIKTLEKYPLENASIKCSMADIYLHMYEVENNYKNFEYAIDYYKQTFEVYNEEQLTLVVK